MRGFAVLLLLVACAGISPNAPRLTYAAANVGPPGSNAGAELFVPPGAGPFPAIVVMHTCAGVNRFSREWATRLAGWGYVALMPDSFRPRGVSNVCNQGNIVSTTWRAADALAAADFLRTLPNVRPDRIGVIGFSHGGGAVMRVVLADAVLHETPMRAAVAFYPPCQSPRSPLVTDTLILIGAADDWSSPDACQRFADQAVRGGHTLDLKIYPSALHSFDSAQAAHFYAGHLIGRNDDAARDAVRLTREFLERRLGAGELK